MKCHYDVLNVARDAVLDDIKKAYKKLAIKWHPDKNLDNTEAATEQFQLIQQAFEVLSDPHERAWYDDHRDAILKGKVGSECEDNSLDVYQYFTASCYKGFGDDEKGFYSVYREVFNKIAAEDSEYYEDGDSDYEIPSFGKSSSSADEVKMFYAHWQSYCTKKTYSWLDPFDTRTAENRRVSRLIDKENKKVRDKARKARNEEVRELVNFVRKRDKRVQAQAQELVKLNAERARQTEERRQEKIKKQKAELASHEESEWSKFSNLESELRGIEANLASEFGETTSDDSDTNIDDQLYCIACNKLFKTTKAFQNHESSKKHKENVVVLKQNMLDGSDSEIVTDKESTAEEGEVVYEYDGVVSDGLEDDPLFCDPCGKQFNSSKAIEEHKKTKKHIDNYKTYKEAMVDILGKDDEPDSDKSSPSINPFAESKAVFKEYLGSDDEIDERFNGDEVSQRICSQIDEFTKDNDIIKQDVDKICKQLDELFDGTIESDDARSFGLVDELPITLKKKMTTKQKNILDSDDDDFFSDSRKKQKKKQKTKIKSQNDRKKNGLHFSGMETDSSAVNSIGKESETSSVSQDSVLVTKSTVSSKEKTANKSNNRKKRQTEDSVNDIGSTCAVCKATFPSRTKLFLHLSKTGHSIYIDDKEKLLNKVKEQDSECSTTNKKNKSRKKL